MEGGGGKHYYTKRQGKKKGDRAPSVAAAVEGRTTKRAPRLCAVGSSTLRASCCTRCARAAAVSPCRDRRAAEVV
jgi:hypothetical protein